MMKLAILCIGDELLKGATTNTNLAFLGNELLEIGILPTLAMEVPDAREPILDALDYAFRHVDVILTSGGLGPTADDVTREYIAQKLGRRLEENGEVTLQILQYWKSRHAGERIPPRVLNQSLVPDGAEVLRNECGTAPGLFLQVRDSEPWPGKTIIMLPGPPNELQPMFRAHVAPRLRKQCVEPIHSKMFQLCGIGESEVEERMIPVIARTSGLSVAYCAAPQAVRLFLTGRVPETLGSAMSEVRLLFAEELLRDEAVSLPHEVMLLLQEKNLTLAVVESCTGGLLAKTITDLPGSSAVFRGGIVAYHNDLKAQRLGVKEETLAKFGAVSRECALEMARGARDVFGADIAVSLTGIAGPDGATPEKPVGLVYAAIVSRDGTEDAVELRLRRSREQIRERAVANALNLLRKKLCGRS